MKKSSYLLLVSFSLMIYSCSKSDSGSSGGTTTPTTPTIPTTPTTPLTYQLVWSDEFNSGSMPDTTKWGYDVGGNGWGNNELEYYTNARQENARIVGGNLVIETRRESFGGRNYTSARLLTKNKAKWTYGKFEIRAKIPKGKGTWPAIWTLANTNPLVWPDDGELDIMEEVGHDPNNIFGTAHTKLYNGANGKQKGGNVLIKDAQDTFHVYSMEWTESAVTWFVDGNFYFTYNNPNTGSDAWPFTKDFFIILNVAIGGNWGGAQGVDDSIFPQSMLVDYVRVYQKK